MLHEKFDDAVKQSHHNNIFTAVRFKLVLKKLQYSEN